MDLQSMLLQMLPSSLYRGAAQSRITRTPVLYGKADAGAEGSYYPPNINDPLGHPPIQDLLKMFVTGLPMGKGLIAVDPEASAKAGNTAASTLQHEDIHAALQPLNQQLYDIQKNVPYSQLAQRMTMAGRSGDKIIETPAYMGAYKESETGVPQVMRDMYVQGFHNQLAATRPDIAATYDRLAHPTAIAATAKAGENGGGQ